MVLPVVIVFGEIDAMRVIDEKTMDHRKIRQMILLENTSDTGDDVFYHWVYPYHFLNRDV